MRHWLIVFEAELEDALNEKQFPREHEQMHWWLWLAIVLAGAAVLLYGLFRWAAGAPEIDDEIAKKRFREEQEWRGLRRSGENSPPSSFVSKRQKIIRH